MMERLPCGCQFGVVNNAFVYEPCSLDCEWYKFVLAEAQRQGKPTTTLDLR